ncbi:ShlB/FhaC/HecB family hemolysin secretion/activation protein [Methylocucumis oryzae]|uniref:ShlB/FhaC/HecB family hemolysin secretion/activation protein n=1 Tax=Methylocucumis oryzae TaxID=1632867 RepID=UPI000D6E09D3|nr:ShlB/FhaC/HecB family hemolysin secretion/activation protein [Methylocucumis oryzae]
MRYGSTLSINWQRWLIQTTFIGQHSDDRLIAGEQLGIGGSYDVRGYQERETSADSGQIVKLEVTTQVGRILTYLLFMIMGMAPLIKLRRVFVVIGI